MIEALLLAATLHVHCCSIHPGDRSAYNERNYGIGLQIGDWTADVFRDSHHNRAGLAGRVYETDYHGLKVGAIAGVGYHTNWKGPVVIPSVRWQGKRAGVRMIFMPSRGGGVYGFSMTVPLTEERR
jgi:hypothetical protein